MMQGRRSVSLSVLCRQCADTRACPCRSLRPGSGGVGAFRGGDGVVREMEVRSALFALHVSIFLVVLSLHRATPALLESQFLRPLTVGILSERRALPPWGLAGGGDAARGVNLWLQRGGVEAAPPRAVSLGGKATVVMQAFDRLRLLTPGGGGYGAADGAAAVVAPPHAAPGVTPPHRIASGSLASYTTAQETV